MPSTHTTVISADRSGRQDEQVADAERLAEGDPEVQDRDTGERQDAAGQHHAGHLGRGRQPVVEVGGPTGDLRTSSTAPTACITSTAMTSPSGSVLALNTSAERTHRPGRGHAGEEPGEHPHAAERGGGAAWTRRSSGAWTSWWRQRDLTPHTGGRRRW
jgi:hypothetical protein